ncbi:acetyltransferase [Vibrio mimicus]|nr:acetyltransferase [Vibrio mimicus]
MVAVVVFEFSGMRCQPLRRALCTFSENILVSRWSWS